MAVSKTDKNPAYEHGYMRQKELLELLPFSKATLWRKVQTGEFVRPIKLSQRVTAWRRASVMEWLKKKETV